MLNSPGMAPPVKRGPRFSQLRFLPIVLTTTLTAALPSSSGSVAVMFVSVRLPPIGAEQHSEPLGHDVADREVAADRVVLQRPGNVAASSGQRDIPVDRDPVQQNGVRVGCGHISVDSDDRVPGLLDGARMCRVRDVTERLAAQPEHRARGRSDVVADGDRRRRALRIEHAPAATFRLPTTLITASGTTLQTPVTVMLA